MYYLNSDLCQVGLIVCTLQESMQRCLGSHNENWKGCSSLLIPSIGGVSSLGAGCSAMGESCL